MPLFDSEKAADAELSVDRRKMREPIQRIDGDEELRKKLLPLCRLDFGQEWQDEKSGHKVAVIDATDSNSVKAVFAGASATACIADPPYNVVVGARNTPALGQMTQQIYDQFTAAWLDAVMPMLTDSASLYVWLGADMKNGFHPLPEFCLEMRRRPEWVARNWITVRNQRGYGTQMNWMWVRQELLYYAKNRPTFNIEAEYTDIPKTLKGYYKDVDGKKTENTERGKGNTIRAGNVWVDIQQVFYRLHENVPGCYAQKPFKSIERLIKAASNKGDLVVDPFSHSGTTLLAAETLGRRCFTFDNDPIYAEITIRRLERYRKTGQLGWQCDNPFPELG
ncbi:MAG: DNA-methyltransferase [Erythrobacter sp.]